MKWILAGAGVVHTINARLVLISRAIPIVYEGGG